MSDSAVQMVQLIAYLCAIGVSIVMPVAMIVVVPRTVRSLGHAGMATYPFVMAAICLGGFGNGFMLLNLPVLVWMSACLVLGRANRCVPSVSLIPFAAMYYMGMCIVLITELYGQRGMWRFGVEAFTNMELLIVLRLWQEASSTTRIAVVVMLGAGSVVCSVLVLLGSGDRVLRFMGRIKGQTNSDAGGPDESLARSGT